MSWPLVASVAGMLLYGLASVGQGYAAAHAAGPAVLRHPAYVFGLVCDVSAWLVSIVALSALPLFVVQSILAGSLAVTVLLAAPVLGVRVTARDALAVGVVTLGLALVSGSAGGESTAPTPSWFALTSYAALAVTGVVGVAVYPRGRPWAAAVLSGWGFGASALAVRAAQLGEGSLIGHLIDPLTWTAVAFGAFGAVFYAQALELGSIGSATATMWVVEVVVPGSVGVLVLGDGVRAGWAVPALVGIALAVSASVVLAYSPAHAVESAAHADTPAQDP